MTLRLPKFATRNSESKCVLGLQTPKIGISNEENPWIAKGGCGMNYFVADDNKIPTSGNEQSISLNDIETDELVEDLLFYQQNFEECIETSIRSFISCPSAKK